MAINWGCHRGWTGYCDLGRESLRRCPRNQLSAQSVVCVQENNVVHRKTPEGAPLGQVHVTDAVADGRRFQERLFLTDRS
ncbi:hypothetical protein ACIRG5_28020 [Lentzea sp. NPDC102401]|uniref:hypothetical protein n=1 Tax=Lentzea sp. NPDC102401 TaxID=3364128 RepID=UPI0038252D6D